MLYYILLCYMGGEPINMVKAEKIVCINKYSAIRPYSLKEVSLTVLQGECFCILGAAGAGKSSLVHAFVGLQPISDGELFVCGLDCRKEENHSDIRKKCAVVLEEAEELYISNSVWSEVSFAARNFLADAAELEDKVSTALSKVGMEGYENKSVPLLSGFERYCLAIAAAIVHEPEMILLDSVAAGFDEAERSRILAIIKNLHRSGMTVVYTTCNAQDAVMADKLLVLKEGCVLGCDEPRKIFADPLLLDEAGLELPFTVRVYRDLLDSDVRLDRCPLDIDELVEEVCR